MLLYLEEVEQIEDVSLPTVILLISALIYSTASITDVAGKSEMPQANQRMIPTTYSGPPHLVLTVYEVKIRYGRLSKSTISGLTRW